MKGKGVVLANYYCKNCGKKFLDPRTLAANLCQRHPDGCNKGKHQLYEGTEKSTYVCKYCGRSFHDIITMTANSCHQHPSGANKGKHSPAL